MFDRELENARDLRGIVVDVRKYYHSSAEALYEILGRFIEEPINGFRYRQRISGTNQFLEHSTTVEPRGSWTFNKPVLIVYDIGWPSCGFADIMMQRSNTDSVQLSASTGHIMSKEDRWPFYVYGLQDSVPLPYGFTAWIPTSQVMHPSLNIPETQGQTIVLIGHPPTQFSIPKATKDIWKRKQFRTLVRNYEKSEKKKRKDLH